MNYDKMFSIVEDLPFDTEEDIYLSKRERIYLLRPSVLSKKYSSYDPKTNIQVWFRRRWQKTF